MKYCYCLCLLLLSFFARADYVPGMLRLTDSLIDGPQDYTLALKWKFNRTDSIVFAGASYDDSHWVTLPSMFFLKEIEQYKADKGIGWFRLSLWVDSGMTNRPFVVQLSGDGAATLYADGKLIRKIGQYAKEEKDGYVKLQSEPGFISFAQPGLHVLAVRYEHNNLKENDEWQWGFRIDFERPNRLVHRVEDNTRLAALFLLTLGSLFGTLFFVHLLMFLFYKKDISNIYFSLFNLSISILLFSVYVILSSDESFSHQKTTGYVIIVSGVLACYSITAFSTYLFSKSKILFRIIVALCLLQLLFFCFPDLISADLNAYSMSFLLGAISVYVVVLMIRAMLRKVPGSRILGIGILFFIFFVASLAVVIIVSGGGITVENPLVSQVLFVLILLAIFSIPLSLSSYLAWRFSATSKNLQLQLDNVAQLSERSLQQEQEKQHILLNQKEALEEEVLVRTKEIRAQKLQLETEKQKSDELLLNILPAEVAEELKQQGKTKAQYFGEVSVLFTDFVNFTQISEELGPEELIAELNTCFTAFDHIMEKYGLEKIKTIGDAYLAVSGLPQANPAHAVNAVKAALEIVTFIDQRRKQLHSSFDIRIGINSGPLVAGIVGIKKFAYDIWGDTVNTAARMEQNSEGGKVNISENTFRLVQETFTCVHRGKVSAKNKGDMDMYFVVGEKA